MANKDRIGIDISDLRERIETCRDDVNWQESAMSVKCRTLIIERLEQLEARPTKMSLIELLADLIDDPTNEAIVNEARDYIRMFGY